MNVRLHFLFTLLTASLIPQTGGAQELSTDVRQKIGKFLDATARKEVSVGRIRIDSVSIEGNTLQLFANINCDRDLPRCAGTAPGRVFEVQPANPHE